jgi:hypothetical protein
MERHLFLIVYESLCSWYWSALESRYSEKTNVYLFLKKIKPLVCTCDSISDRRNSVINTIDIKMNSIHNNAIDAY